MLQNGLRLRENGREHFFRMTCSVDGVDGWYDTKEVRLLRLKSNGRVSSVRYLGGLPECIDMEKLGDEVWYEFLKFYDEAGEEYELSRCDYDC